MSYSDTDVERAIAAYVVHGTFAAAERETGVSADALRQRKNRNPQWFEDIVTRIRLDHEEEHRAIIRKVVVSGTAQVLDRIENGDFVQDDKGEYTKRKPLAGRDAAWISAVMIDKLRLSLGQATSISAKAGESSGDKLAALREAATSAAKEQAREDGKLVDLEPAASAEVLPNKRVA
jgi:hypothetical protein